MIRDGHSVFFVIVQAQSLTGFCQWGIREIFVTVWFNLASSIHCWLILTNPIRIPVTIKNFALKIVDHYFLPLGVHNKLCLSFSFTKLLSKPTTILELVVEIRQSSQVWKCYSHWTWCIYPKSCQTKNLGLTRFGIDTPGSVTITFSNLRRLSYLYD